MLRDLKEQEESKLREWKKLERFGGKKARLKKEIREKGKENVANFGGENNSLDSGKW